MAWIAPAFVPELGAVLADGGGEVAAQTGRGSSVRRRPRRRTARAATRARAAGRASAGARAAVAAAAPPGRRRRAPAPPVSTLSYSSLGEYARCGYRFYAERVLGLPGRA